MNKLTKAAIAGGVGIALLLGGAGTLATWNSSSTISGGTIVAGNLLVGTSGTSGIPVVGSWAVAHLGPGTTAYGTPTPLTTLTGFTASPGDQLTYTTTLPIIAHGTNLVATLSLSGGAITATPAVAPATAVPANTALANALLASAVVGLSGGGITAGTALNTYVINGSGGGVSTNATVTATITFPIGAAGDNNAAMSGSVDFSKMALTLTQNS